MGDEKIDWLFSFRGYLKRIDLFELPYSPTYNELLNPKICGGECHFSCY
jgi:hypothetical protein